jgi:hypothetical protein
MPLKGMPMGGGWHAAGIATALLVNGAWGLGTGHFLRLGHEQFAPKTGFSVIAAPDHAVLNS